jgi:hypothetical protein
LTPIITSSVIVKAKSPTKPNDENLVPERDTNDTEATKESNLVTNVVVVGEDSGYQILSRRDEEAEREKPKKVISTKVHLKRTKQQRRTRNS